VASHKLNNFIEELVKNNIAIIENALKFEK
jgi:hypothetical protein